VSPTTAPEPIEMPVEARLEGIESLPSALNVTLPAFAAERQYLLRGARSC